MAKIPIRDVIKTTETPSGDEYVLIDNGIDMSKATINDAVKPKATEIADQKIADLNLGTASQANVEDFATAEQGGKADSAVQPGDLAPVATSGDYNDLANLPTLGTASTKDIEYFATADRGLPSGGGTGEVLVKNSGSDYDAEWREVASTTAVSYAPQTLTPAEQGQARANIGVGNTFNTVAALLADDTMSYTPGTDLIEVGPGDIIEAQGFRYEVAASDATNAHVETAGGVKLLVVGDTINVEALGWVAEEVDPNYDNGPHVLRLAELINKTPIPDAPLTIDFPPHIYRTSQTLQITRSHVFLRGLTTMDGALNYSPTYASGAQITYTGSDAALVAERADGGFIGIYMENLRFSSAGQSPKPDLVRLIHVNEFWVKDCKFVGGARHGLVIAGGYLGSIIDCAFSVNENHVVFDDTGDSTPFASTSLWFQRLNFWQAGNASVLFRCKFVHHITFSDCWFERALRAVHVASWHSGTTELVQVAFDNCRFVIDASEGYPDNRDGWLLTVVGNQGNTTAPTILRNWRFDGCQIHGASNGAAIVVFKLENTATTTCQELVIDNCEFTGAGNYNILSANADLNCSFTAEGSFVAAGKNWGGGGWRHALLNRENGQFRMVGRPLSLPRGNFTDLTDEGQIRYDPDVKFLRFTDGQGPTVIPKQGGVVPDSTATSVTELRDDFNNLLAKLRSSRAIE